jgi:hypothetical protein
MYAGKNNPYGLNVNRLLKKDPYASAADAEWVTLADIVKDYIEHPVGQMNQRQQLRKRFDTYYKLITEDWGGKHYAALKPLQAEVEATKAKLAATPKNVALNFTLADQLTAIKAPERYAQFSKAVNLQLQAGSPTLPDAFYQTQFKLMIAQGVYETPNNSLFQLIDYLYSSNSTKGYIHYFKGVRQRHNHWEDKDRYKPYFKQAAKLGYATLKEMEENSNMRIDKILYR